MRRRSTASSKRAKARSRKAKPLKRSAQIVRHSRSSDYGQETEVARLSRERNEALEQLTAASEVLKVISSLPGELGPVFQSMLENATRLCEANLSNFFLYEAGVFRNVAQHGQQSKAYSEFLQADWAAAKLRRAGGHRHRERAAAQ
jgi:hypothetical protein